MNTYALWEVAKLLSVGLLAAGCGLAVASSEAQDRRWGVHWLVTPGLLLSWLTGWAMARTAGISLGSTWISSGMLLSLLGLAVLVWSTERPETSRRWAAWLGVAAFAGTTALMVMKPGTRAASDTHAVELNDGH